MDRQERAYSMDDLLIIVNGFGYFIAVTVTLALIAYYSLREEIVSFLDATIQWPDDSTDAVVNARNSAAVVQHEVDVFLSEYMEALSDLPLHVPAWETPEFTHGISLAIIRSHPEGSSSGYDAAYRKWLSRPRLAVDNTH